MAGLAKLTRPRLHQVVPRERLFERLDEACRRPLAWIVGPPGAGKTSLVASYVEARKRSGVWYHVDGGAHESLAFCQRNHSRPRRSSSSPMTAPAIIATMWEGGCCRRGVVMPRR